MVKFCMRVITTLIIVMSLYGCFLVPHKIEVNQGNFIDESMVLLLKPNMTKDQVVYILGTPLLSDPFKPNQWNYVYLDGEAGNTIKRRELILLFSEDKLVKIDNSN